MNILSSLRSEEALSEWGTSKPRSTNVSGQGVGSNIPQWAIWAPPLHLDARCSYRTPKVSLGITSRTLDMFTCTCSDGIKLKETRNNWNFRHNHACTRTSCSRHMQYTIVHAYGCVYSSLYVLLVYCICMSSWYKQELTLAVAYHCHWHALILTLSKDTFAVGRYFSMGEVMIVRRSTKFWTKLEQFRATYHARLHHDFWCLKGALQYYQVTNTIAYVLL